MSLITSLSAYYKLDGNPNASFGSNNGTNNGGLTYGPGIINQGGVFNGTNAYVTMPPATDFNFGSGDFGVSVWFKRNALSQGFILGQCNSAGGNPSASISIQMNGANRLEANIFQGGAYTPIVDTTTITDTNWHHCVFTRSGTSFYLYVDNVLKTTVTLGSWANNNSSNYMSFGRIGEYTALYFSGSVDEVGFWKQSLIPYVSALYNAGAGLSYPFDPNPVGPINYLIVGGGGSGGSANGGVGGGGGGAGGVLTGGTSLVLGTYPIVVGSGGTINGNGADSTFNSLIAIGGTRGRYYNDSGILTGGSGGGGGGYTSIYVASAGTPGQGNFGGVGNQVSHYNSGGGGGAGSLGLPYSGFDGGAGGAGVSNSISGTATFYAGGGGGAGGNSTLGIGGLGGSGIGGNGGLSTSAPNAAGLPGVPNTGSGGGGAASYSGGPGGNGGSGIVILSYTTGSVTALGGTITTAGGNTIHTFTTSGNFSIFAGNANFLTMFDN